MDHSPSKTPIRVAFSELIDLASEAVGGQVLYANDEFFAPKENLLKLAHPIFIADKYIDTGKWMDGWETRRKRVAGYDHCIVKLGLPGEIHGVNIDTSFFTGNYPEYASIDAVEVESNVTLDQLKTMKWTEVLSKTALAGGTQNFFPIVQRARFTHLRLNVFPDGGVARLRVHGLVKKSAEQLKGTIDLAAAENGSVVVTANDNYFGPKDNLTFPGRAKVMGEGWETRRKRGPGYDWIIVKLCGAGKISKIEVDTNHFKGNFPDRCSIDVLDTNENLLACDFRDRTDLNWKELLPQSKLQAHHQHYFEKELLAAAAGSCRYLRLNIFPDGGVSRLRVWGELLR